MGHLAGCVFLAGRAKRLQVQRVQDGGLKKEGAAVCCHWISWGSLFPSVVFHGEKKIVTNTKRQNTMLGKPSRAASSCVVEERMHHLLHQAVCIGAFWTAPARLRLTQSVGAGNPFQWEEWAGPM